MTTTTGIDELAQSAAEHIARDLIPAQDLLAGSPWVTVEYPDDRRPPRDIAAIKAALLVGQCWVSWMDDEVQYAMRVIQEDRGLVAHEASCTFEDLFGDRVAVTISGYDKHPDIGNAEGVSIQGNDVHLPLVFSAAEARRLAKKLIAAADDIESEKARD